jgi:hypothetical protein
VPHEHAGGARVGALGGWPSQPGRGPLACVSSGVHERASQVLSLRRGERERADWAEVWEGQSLDARPSRSGEREAG